MAEDRTSGGLGVEDVPCDAPRIRRLLVVVNPGAGRETPILGVLDSVLTEAGVDWHVAVTHRAGDAGRASREAVAAGVDAVAAYGGDGTVREVAEALEGADIPLAILPGGTGNVLAIELGVPLDLESAARLVSHGGCIRRIDLLRSGDERRFALRAGIGWEAETVEGASREMKERVGYLAYVLSGLRGLAAPATSRFRITVDGETTEDEGITCVVANSGSLGFGTLTLHPAIRVDDGVLDVVLIRRGDAAALAHIGASAAGLEEVDADVLRHWRGREARVEADPARPVVIDGESEGTTPFCAAVIPGAVRVLVPSDARESTRDEPAAAGGRRQR